jgi:hypothetical protein
MGERRETAPRRRRTESALSHIVIVLLVAAFIFRKPLMRLLARQFPNRAKRQQVLGTIITAIVLVIALRVLALFW